MKLEHFAFNTEDPLAMAEWYIEHMGLKIVSQQREAPYMTFMTDNSGAIMFEFYKNPPDQVPDYHTMSHLQFHMAFVTENAEQDKQRLIGSGATFDHELIMEDGSHMVMMRDPWGLAVQLWQRKTPILK